MILVRRLFWVSGDKPGLCNAWEGFRLLWREQSLSRDMVSTTNPEKPAGMSPPTTNLHIFLSPFTHESRALKESRSLIEAKLFGKVLFAAIWRKTLAEHESIDACRTIWRVKLFTRKLPFFHTLKYVEWTLRIILQTYGEHVSVVHVHSLSALPAGLAFKWLRRAKLVYDAHELETESNGLVGNRKKIYKALEKILIPYVDSVLVVGESIADWYRKTYSLSNVNVIRNIPDTSTQLNFLDTSDSPTRPNLKRELKISDHESLFIYQGGIFVGRGIQILLTSFSKLPPDKHIVFMGYGELEGLVKEYSEKFSNIHFYPAVHPNEVLSYTRTADVGISLIENICLSYYYCLPNKVFEYMSAGLPLIVSNFPEMAKLVDSHNTGWKTEVDPDSLVHLIQTISRTEIKKAHEEVLSVRDLYRWEFEQEKLLNVYRSMLE